MKAILENYRQSPRKVRLVANLIKGKSVEEAVVELDFLAKRAADPLKKLLNSAVANATNNHKADKEQLYVESVMVNKGITLKRFMPRARGSASPIHKHTSQVIIILGQKTNKAKKAK
ncbi:MAG: 50S ribosomal protein L22 [Minisyncoccia bacterium]